MLAFGVDEYATIEFLRRFFEGLPANPREPLSSSGRYGSATFGKSRGQYYTQHIRFFASSESPIIRDNVPRPGVTYQRVNGLLESLGAAGHLFEEHRITIFCSRELGRDNSPMKPDAILMIALEDIAKGYRERVHFEEWTDRGFTVVGANAAHHLLQAAFHGALRVWAEQWLETLDALDDLVSTEVSTGANHCWHWNKLTSSKQRTGRRYHGLGDKRKFDVRH